MRRALYTIYRLRRIVALNFMLTVAAGVALLWAEHHTTGRLNINRWDAVGAALLVSVFLSTVVSAVLWPSLARETLLGSLAFPVVIVTSPLWTDHSVLEGNLLRTALTTLVLLWIVGYGIKLIAKFIGMTTLPQSVKMYAEVDVDLPPDKVFDGMRLETSLPGKYGDGVARDAFGGFVVTWPDGAQMRTRQTADPYRHQLVERATTTAVPGLDATAITMIVPRQEGSALQTTEITDGMPLWIHWAMWAEDSLQDVVDDHRDRLENRPRLALSHRIDKRLFSGVPD